MIFDMVIYVTLINLTELECILLLLLNSHLFLCSRVLESLTLDKSKLYFVEMKTSNICYIANVNVYRYSNLIKPDNYLTLLLPTTSKTNTSVPSMFQGLMNIEGIWVQHSVSPEPFILLL